MHAGISDVRDESDREGMRVVIEVKRGSSAEVRPAFALRSTKQSSLPIVTPTYHKTCMAEVIQLRHTLHRSNHQAVL